MLEDGLRERFRGISRKRSLVLGWADVVSLMCSFVERFRGVVSSSVGLDVELLAK